MSQIVLLNPEQAAQKMASSSLTVIDIRDTAAFAQSHIPQAQHLPAQQLAEFSQNTAKTTPILVYCYHGISSQTAADFLLEQGFKKVYSLQGGYTAWQQCFPSITA